MTKRLVDKFRIGDKVQVKGADGKWLQAVVLALDHPGLWVLDEIGRPLFVTNTRHIRRREDAS